MDPDRAEPPRVPLRTAFGAFVVSLALATLFYSTLLFGGALHGYDWGSHHFNYFDWVRESLTTYHTLPLFMNDAWVTKNFLANAEAPSLGPLVWLLCFLPTGTYLKLLLVLFTATGLSGMYFLLRDLAVDPAIAAFAALLFAFNGFFVAHLCVGHPWAMGGELLPVLLLLFRRAVLGSAGAGLGAAALNAFTILGGQHQPFVWQNLFLAAFACAWGAKLRSLRPLATYALIALASFGLGAVKLLPMLAEFADYAPQARTVGLPPGLLLRSLAGGGQGPDLVAPGIPYAHGGGWWEYAFYVGPVGVAALAVGLTRARAALPLVAVGAAFLLLAFGGPVWNALADLPVMRTQRSPSRFAFLALFAFSAAAGVGLERLWADTLARAPRALRALVLVLALLAAADLEHESRAWQRAAIGAPLAARDHRPHPLRLEDPGRALAELRVFAPNRLVYRVRATRDARIVFPFRLAEGSREWRVEGLPATSVGGKLAVDVPAGERDVVMRYRPALFGAGAATSAASVLALGVGLAWRARCRRR